MKKKSLDQINGKFNDISSADENKSSLYLKNYKKTNTFNSPIEDSEVVLGF
jgi:hypothetical protein